MNEDFFLIMLIKPFIFLALLVAIVYPIQNTINRKMPASPAKSFLFKERGARMQAFFERLDDRLFRLLRLRR